MPKNLHSDSLTFTIHQERIAVTGAVFSPALRLCAGHGIAADQQTLVAFGEVAAGVGAIDAISTIALAVKKADDGDLVDKAGLQWLGSEDLVAVTANGHVHGVMFHPRVPNVRCLEVRSISDNKTRDNASYKQRNTHTNKHFEPQLFCADSLRDPGYFGVLNTVYRKRVMSDPSARLRQYKGQLLEPVLKEADVCAARCQPHGLV